MEGNDDGSFTIELVFQKVGRNLILFQKLEHILKAIVSMAEVSGHPRDLLKNQEDRKAWAMKLTLGTIVGEHLGALNPIETPDVETPLKSDKTFFSMRVSTHCDDDVLSARRTVLAGLVTERNQLVHHLRTMYQLHEEASRRELVAMLDDQHRRLNEEVEISRGLGKSQYDLRLRVAEFLQSEEGRRLFYEGMNSTEADIDGPI